LKAPVGDFSIDLGGRDLLMAEGFLHQIQVAGFVIQPGSEGMAQGVDRSLVYPGGFEPHRYPLLDLAAAQSPAITRLKQRNVAGVSFIREIFTQYLFELGIDKNRLLSIAFGCDFNDSLFQQNIACIEVNQRAKPDSGGQQKRDHNEVTLCQIGFGLLDCFQKLFGISLGQRLGNLPGCLGRFNKPRRTLLQAAGVDEIAEECPNRGFDSIYRNRRSGFTVARHLNFIRGEESGDGIRLYFADILIAQPSHKQSDIPQISQPGMLAFAIGDKLRFKMPDGGFKFHNYLPVLVDSACHTNGYVLKLIKSIMRTILNTIRNYRDIARITPTVTRHSPAVGLSLEAWPGAA